MRSLMRRALSWVKDQHMALEILGAPALLASQMFSSDRPTLPSLGCGRCCLHGFDHCLERVSKTLPRADGVYEQTHA